MYDFAILIMQNVIELTTSLVIISVLYSTELMMMCGEGTVSIATVTTMLYSGSEARLLGHFSKMTL